MSLARQNHDHVRLSSQVSTMKPPRPAQLRRLLSQGDRAGSLQKQPEIYGIGEMFMLLGIFLVAAGRRPRRCHSLPPAATSVQDSRLVLRRHLSRPLSHHHPSQGHPLGRPPVASCPLPCGSTVSAPAASNIDAKLWHYRRVGLVPILRFETLQSPFHSSRSLPPRCLSIPCL